MKRGPFCSKCWEDEKKSTMTILAPWTQADVLNKNSRKYPLALLKREINKVQEKAEC